MTINKSCIECSNKKNNSKRCKKCEKIHKKEIHSKGQYFTEHDSLKKCVYDFIQNEPDKILEPSVGRGDLVSYVLEKNSNVTFDMFEIDEKITVLDGIVKDDIHYNDFLKECKNIKYKYKTIIGNPPYVKPIKPKCNFNIDDKKCETCKDVKRAKNLCRKCKKEHKNECERCGNDYEKRNLYLCFIDECYELLENGGELIFIVPSDFMKLTSSAKLLNKMLENGTFTHIYHPNDENLFENASIDIIVFRYCKDSTLSNKIKFNDEDKYLINSKGTITFYDVNPENLTRLEEYFDIHVGMVTGKESFFKNDEFGNVSVINYKDNVEKYILIDKYPTDDDKLNKYFKDHKKELKKRKIRKFNENNWFEWGALRNYKKIKENMGKDCIYISNMTRNKEVAFKDKVQYFGGGLIMLLPKKEIDLDKVVEYLNSDKYKKNYMYSGRFKIGQRQLCNSLFNVNL